MKWLDRWRQIKNKDETISELFGRLSQSEDFVSRDHNLKKMTVRISYIKPIIDMDALHRDILPALIQSDGHSLEDLMRTIPFAHIIRTSDVDEIKKNILTGSIYIQENKEDPKGILIEAPVQKDRPISPPEVETSVVGPKESFVDTLDTNIYLLRKRLPLPNLKVKEVVVGKVTKTKVAIVYIEGIANKENVNTVTQRIKNIEYDQIIDSSFIEQMISDDYHSPFPQMMDTERPDRTVSGLVEGKVVVLVDGSSFALLGPTTIVEFFSVFDDYALNWYLASFLRMVRLASVAFSVLASSFYVAVLTYHYQIIPKNLMATLISSRMGIPFPPIIEALLMELTIEILREAGVRLPTKVGQTIGIVGGIVIGTAAVDASLTSNVLLILVAMGALASFTTPNYKMNNTVRLIRFPFLIAAGFWGLFGIAVAFGLFVAHLVNLKSLDRPYIEPFYPFRPRDLKDAFFRLPYTLQKMRPMQLRPEDPGRMNGPRALKKRDIDE